MKGEEGRKSFMSHENCVKFKRLGAKEIKAQLFNHRLNMNINRARVIIDKKEERKGGTSKRIFLKKM